MRRMEFSLRHYQDVRDLILIILVEFIVVAYICIVNGLIARWSLYNHINDIFHMRAIVLNYLIVTILFLLAISIYFSNYWDHAKWKRSVVHFQLCLYCLYYIFYCWIILEARSEFFKNYIIQTFFISMSLWNHLYSIRYKYLILLIFQLFFISIALSISNLDEDIWDYIIVSSAFLMLLFCVEGNGKLRLDLLQSQQNGICLLQQDFKQPSKYQEPINVNSERNTNQRFIQKTCLCGMATENKVNTYQETYQQYLKQQQDTSPKDVITQQQPSFLYKFTLNKNINNMSSSMQVNHDNVNNTTPLTPIQNNIHQASNLDMGSSFSSKENMLKQFKNNIGYQLTNKDSDKLSPQNQQLQIKDEEEDKAFITPIKVQNEKTDEMLQQYTQKRVSFSELPISRKAKTEFQDGNLQNCVKRDTINRHKDNNETSQTIDSIKINNIILQRMHSQEDIKQNSSSKKIIQENEIPDIKHQNENIYEINDEESIETNQGRNEQNCQNNYHINVVGKGYFNNQNQNNIAGILKDNIPQVPLKQKKLIQQNNPQNNNSVSQKCIPTNQDSFYLQNDNNQQAAEQGLGLGRRRLQMRALRQSRSQEEYFIENIHNFEQDQCQRLANQRANTFKVQFNDYLKQLDLGKNQNQSSNLGRNSILSNAADNQNSMSVRLKLHELEKNAAQTNDQYLLNNNQLIKLLKCSSCNQTISPSKNQIYSYTQINQEDYCNKRSSLQNTKEHKSLQFLKDEELKRNIYEKMVYDTLDCGIIVLNQNISIIHKNRKIHEFFHQSEVNENLMNCLKLVTISDQSVIALKQILLSSNQKQINKNEIKEVSMQSTMWGLKQVNSFLNRLSQENLRVNPISLKEFLQSLFEMFVQKSLKYQLKDLALEVFQVIFNQNQDQEKQQDITQNPMFMAVQFKIYFSYRSELDQYECILGLINTRQRDIAIKKEISESISHRIFQTLSHEFGTYMNIISNITENALEDEKISVELKKDYFRIINTNSILLENVIKDMRDFFSIMNQKLEVKWNEMNLKETIFQTLELFKKQFQLKKLKTSIKIQKGIIIDINSDGSFIKQILSNLISNSLKFTLSGQIKVFLFKHSNRYLRLEVEDSGIGMSSEECERLKSMLKNGFSDEKISKNSVGLGFGLLISNNLARLIGNPLKKQAIYFQSHPQEGSKFWILINAQMTSTLQSQQDPSKVKKRSFFSKQIAENATTSKIINQVSSKIIQKNEKQGITNPVKDPRRLKSISESTQQALNEFRSKTKTEGSRDIINRDQYFHDEISSNNSSDSLEIKVKKSKSQVTDHSLTKMVVSNAQDNIKVKDKSFKVQNLTVITNKIIDKYMQYQYGEIIDENDNQQVKSHSYDQYKKSIKQNQSLKTLEYSSHNNGQQQLKSSTDKNLIKDKVSTDFNHQYSYSSQPSPMKVSHSGQTKKMNSQTPRLSMESSQMISSKIVQIKSRARHTITNKQTFVAFQQMVSNGSVQNDTPINLEHSQDNNMQKTQLQISRIPLSTFETPNYITMNSKNARVTQTPKSIVLHQQFSQFGTGTITSPSPLKPKDTLLFYGSNQHSSLFGYNNHNNTQTLNYIKTSNESEQVRIQNNPQNEQQQQTHPEHKISIDKHLIPNSNRHSMVLSNKSANANLNTKNFISSKIVEEQIEDETKLNYSLCQSSDNYSSMMSEQCSNFTSSLQSNSSHPQVQQKQRKESQFQQADKNFEFGNNFLMKQKDSENFYSQANSKSNNSRSNDTHDEQLECTDNSQSNSLTTTNNSISIEYIAQRDQIEYSEYDFEENMSLDDLDVANQQCGYLKTPQINQSMSQASPPVATIKKYTLDYKLKPQNSIINVQNNNNQVNNNKNNTNTNNNKNGNQNSSNQKLDKWFEEISHKKTKTVNEFHNFSPTKLTGKILKEEFVSHLSHNNTITNDDFAEENISINTFPSEISIQKMENLIKVEHRRGRKSIDAQNNKRKRSLINVQRVANSVGGSDEQIKEGHANEKGVTSIMDQRGPSLQSVQKHQKFPNSSSSSIQENIFSFGLDNKLPLQDPNSAQQISRYSSENGGKQSSVRSLPFKQRGSIPYSQFTQNSPKNSQSKGGESVPQEQPEPKQYKILCLDENNQEILKQYTKQISLNNVHSYSQQTMSMMNVDEHELYSPIKININPTANTNLSNINNQKKILLVDDEIFNIFSLKLIFSKFGLKDHILEAYNGQQAIDIIMNQQGIKSKRNNEQGCQIGLIIMDVNMPIMNGIECTRYIRELENSQTIKYSPNIIGYTAYSDSQTRNECYAAGMDDILLKPSRRDDFISILERYYLNP